VKEESKEADEYEAKSYKDDTNSASSFTSGEKSQKFKNNLFSALGPNNQVEEQPKLLPFAGLGANNIIGHQK
jgi:hypothetical protein